MAKKAEEPKKTQAEEKAADQPAKEEKAAETKKESNSKKEKQVTCTYVGPYHALDTNAIRFKQGIPTSVSESQFKTLKAKYGKDLIEGAPKKK